MINATDVSTSLSHGLSTIGQSLYLTKKLLVHLHILLSTIVFVVLCITALQAMVVALEWMEKLLFQMMIIGFVCLTLVLLTSIWSFYPLINLFFWQKFIVSLFAWLVFATLLFGRQLFGWRGLQVIRWTLGGVFLVILIFIGSEII
jgi:ABC-type uncharacterized transport system permease subunit